jgi:hypothetical protein
MKLWFEGWNVNARMRPGIPATTTPARIAACGAR